MCYIIVMTSKGTTEEYQFTVTAGNKQLGLFGQPSSSNLFSHDQTDCTPQQSCSLGNLCLDEEPVQMPLAFLTIGSRLLAPAKRLNTDTDKNSGQDSLQKRQ